MHRESGAPEEILERLMGFCLQTEKAALFCCAVWTTVRPAALLRKTMSPTRTLTIRIYSVCMFLFFFLANLSRDLEVGKSFLVLEVFLFQICCFECSKHLQLTALTLPLSQINQVFC